MIAKPYGRPSPVRLFIIECPSPLDLLAGRSESQALTEICKLTGHEVASFRVYSVAEFVSICEYVASISDYIDDIEEVGKTTCIHIATHGDSEGTGLAFGKDTMLWDDVAAALVPICRGLQKTIFVVSACHANQQTFTKVLTREVRKDRQCNAPKYVFITDEAKVLWSDAALSWAMFYHQLPRISLDNRRKVMRLLDKIKDSGVGSLRYYRWDTDTRIYRSYPESLTE